MRKIPTTTKIIPITCHVRDFPVIGSQFAKQSIGFKWTISEPCKNHKKPRDIKIIPIKININRFIKT